MDVRYSVYRKKDDFPIAVHANSLQCAKAMGITIKSFHEYASRYRHGKSKRVKRMPKWEVIREEEDGK